MKFQPLDGAMACHICYPFFLTTLLLDNQDYVIFLAQREALKDKELEKKKIFILKSENTLTKRMSSLVVSSSRTHIHFYSKPTKNSNIESFSSIFFRSQMINSRIQLKNPSGMTPRSHSRSSLMAFYVPT